MLTDFVHNNSSLLETRRKRERELGLVDQLKLQLTAPTMGK